MEVELQAALVTAIGMIFAALVGVVGISAILRLRACIKLLCNEVENYHAQEGHLVAEILERDGRRPDDSLIQNKRGELRTEFVADNSRRPTMSPGKVERIRRKFLIYSG